MFPVDTGPPRPLERHHLCARRWFLLRQHGFARFLTHSTAWPARPGLAMLPWSIQHVADVKWTSSHVLLSSSCFARRASSIRSGQLDRCCTTHIFLPAPRATAAAFQTPSPTKAPLALASVPMASSRASAGRALNPVARCQPLTGAEGFSAAAPSGPQLRLKDTEQEEDPDLQQQRQSSSSGPDLDLDPRRRKASVIEPHGVSALSEYSPWEQQHDVSPDDLVASQGGTPTAAAVTAPLLPVLEPSTSGNSSTLTGATISKSTGGAGSTGFGIDAHELACMVSHAFDHDGFLPITVTLGQLVTALRSSVAEGVSGTVEDTAARQKMYGINSLPPPHQVTFLELVLEALDDFTVQALMVSGVLSLALAVLGPESGGVGVIGAAAAAAAGGPSADWLEGAAILGTVALVVTVSAATGYAKESKFRQLNSLKDDVQVRVIRQGGPPSPLPSRQLLVGDLAIVEAGDILQADGLLVAGGEIRLDQSHLTGESDEVVRAPVGLGAPAVVLSGSKVLDGYGKMIVLAVGPYSQQGNINVMMQQASAGGAGGVSGDGGGSSAAATVAVPTTTGTVASAGSIDGELGSAGQQQQRRQRRRRQRSLAGLSSGAAKALQASAAVAAAALATVSSVASYDSTDGIDAADARKGASHPSTSESTSGNATATAIIANPSGSGRGPESEGMRVETFLTQKLQVLAQRIGAFGVAAAAFIFVVNAAAYTAGLLMGAGAGAGAPESVLSGGSAMDIARAYLDLVITSITILVVAVPEGLPLAVTLALAFSVQRMLADNNLVRQLGACETMGAATTICSDKTGTLTSNEMTVVRLWAAGRQFRVVRPMEEAFTNQHNQNNRQPSGLSRNSLNHDGSNQTSSYNNHSDHAGDQGTSTHGNSSGRNGSSGYSGSSGSIHSTRKHSRSLSPSAAELPRGPTAHLAPWVSEPAQPTHGSSSATAAAAIATTGTSESPLRLRSSWHLSRPSLLASHLGPG
ncbi:hypothetical protein VaNZ11_006708, partial [Volvox africanus]